MAPIKNHNSGYYAHAQICNAHNFSLSLNATKFTRTFLVLYLMCIYIYTDMRMRKFLVFIPIRVKLELSF